MSLAPENYDRSERYGRDLSAVAPVLRPFHVGPIMQGSLGYVPMLDLYGRPSLFPDWAERPVDNGLPTLDDITVDRSPSATTHDLDQLFESLAVDATGTGSAMVGAPAEAEINLGMSAAHGGLPPSRFDEGRFRSAGPESPNADAIRAFAERNGYDRNYADIMRTEGLLDLLDRTIAEITPERAAAWDRALDEAQFRAADRMSMDALSIEPSALAFDLDRLGGDWSTIGFMGLDDLAAGLTAQNQSLALSPDFSAWPGPTTAGTPPFGSFEFAGAGFKDMPAGAVSEKGVSPFGIATQTASIAPIGTVAALAQGSAFPDQVQNDDPFGVYSRPEESVAEADIPPNPHTGGLIDPPAGIDPRANADAGLMAALAAAADDAPAFNHGLNNSQVASLAEQLTAQSGQLAGVPEIEAPQHTAQMTTTESKEITQTPPTAVTPPTPISVSPQPNQSLEEENYKPGSDTAPMVHVTAKEEQSRVPTGVATTVGGLLGGLPGALIGALAANREGGLFSGIVDGERDATGRYSPGSMYAPNAYSLFDWAGVYNDHNPGGGFDPTPI